MNNLPIEHKGIAAFAENMGGYRWEEVRRAIIDLDEALGREKDLEVENGRLREVLDRPIIKESPWPESVWVMTIEEYVEAVPDGDLRTAISGLLMRDGWQHAVKYIVDALSKDK